MLGLPVSTEFNKRIPKQKIYENISITPALKKVFVEQIKTIIWRNKLAASTINVEQGKNVNEIEVIEIILNSYPLDESVLQQMDKELPYHVVFVLTNEGKYQIVTAYKELQAGGKNAFRVGEYFHSDWFDEDYPLEINGLNMDAVYESFVRQIASDRLLSLSSSTDSLKEVIEKDNQIRAIKKKIEGLTIKLHKEKQFNKQIEINTEIKKLKKQLEGL